MLFAEVIIPLAVPNTFTYSIPNELNDVVSIGKRVIVQFGKKKIYSAIVVAIHTQKPAYEVKDIIEVLDDKPFFKKIHLEFWQWIADYYMCTPGEVFLAAMPSGLRIESQTQITLEETISNDVNLSDKEKIIVEHLRNQKTLTVSKVSKILGLKNPLKHINSLLNKKVIKIYEHLSSAYKPKYKKLIKLSPLITEEKFLKEAFDKIAKYEKQTKLLMTYAMLSGLYFDEKEKKYIFKEVKKKTC